MAQQSGLYGGIFNLRYKNIKLKVEIIVFGLLAFFTGLYPFLSEWKMLPEFLSFLPLEGTWYYLIVLVIGLLALVIGVRTKSN